MEVEIIRLDEPDATERLTLVETGIRYGAPDGDRLPMLYFESTGDRTKDVYAEGAIRERLHGERVEETQPDNPPTWHDKPPESGLYWFEEDGIVGGCFLFCGETTEYYGRFWGPLLPKSLPPGYILDSGNFVRVA